MNTNKNKVVVDEKRSAWISDLSREDGSFSINLMVCNNGFQSSGAAMYSIEVAKAAHKALGDFIREMDGKR